MTKWIAIFLVAAACGGDDGGGGGDDEGGATCTLSADVSPDTGAGTMTGTGTVECDGPAQVDLEVCVQWDASGSFEDISCQTSSRSDVDQLDLDHVASCGITPGRTFRARVNATIDGVDLDEELSVEASCDP